MTSYVDGFVLVVPKDKISEYTKMAEEGKDAWMRHGALAYYECMGVDLTTKDMGGGKPVEFTKLVNATPDETVWYSFIIFKSRAHREEVNRKVMAEMDKKYEGRKDFTMPFDMKRVTYGGFEAVVVGNSIIKQIP